MTLNEAELAFNQSWMFFQFKYYDINFENMNILVKSGLRDGNHSPLPFFDIEEHDCYFKIDQHSNRTKGCVLLQVKISVEQYSQLKLSLPQFEIK